MRVTVHVPDEIGEAAEQVAKEAGKSVSALYAEAVMAHIGALRRKAAFSAIGGVLGQGEAAPDILEQLEQVRRDDPGRF